MFKQNLRIASASADAIAASGTPVKWQQFWDADAEQHFYFNVTTGKKLWREPPTPFNPAVCFVGDNMVDVLVAINKLQAVARWACA